MDTLLVNITFLKKLLETNITAKEEQEIRAEILVLETEYKKLHFSN